MESSSRAPSKRSKRSITPAPSSALPTPKTGASITTLHDWLDKTIKADLDISDTKLLKCDFTCVFTFRSASGGQREKLFSLMDPPPSVYAADTDWDIVCSSISRWWKMGKLQQCAVIQAYIKLPLERKMEYQANISALMEYQLIRYYNLTHQQNKIVRMQNRIRQRGAEQEASNTSQERALLRNCNLNGVRSRRISFDASVAFERESGSDEEMESVDENVEVGHSTGHFVERTANDSSASRTSLQKVVQTKHIASSLALRRYGSLIDAYVNLVKATPRGNEYLDNTNDFLLVNLRNVQWTSKSGKNGKAVIPFPDQKWTVSVFGRTELHAKRLVGHFIRSIASNDKPDLHDGNYDFHFVCGSNTVSLEDNVRCHKSKIDEERIDEQAEM